jgi:acyl transferase domain-containing protein
MSSISKFSSRNIGYEPIAIIGVGCRFPGDEEDITNVDKLWSFIERGGDAVREVPSERWNTDYYYSQDEKAKGKLYVSNGTFLRWNYKEFDPKLYGITPKEAMLMDPQQRLVLDVALECLTDAKADFDYLIGSTTGVFVGGFMMDHMGNTSQSLNRERMGTHSATSSTMTMLSNRLSYTMGFRGPSLTVDTACSSSLVAAHLACRALQNRDADMCLAGGVNFMLRAETFTMMCKGQFLARDGRSKSFDVSADGYGRGEGCGMVALKRLDDAVADGDDIYSVILGSGCNQDGATSGITVPSSEAQAILMDRVYQQADLSASDIDMFEAHGTGTPVGDPLEVEAIRKVLKKYGAQQSIILSSIKSGLGHQEAAAGIAGLIKATICVKNRAVGPQSWLDSVNPKLKLDETPLKIAVKEKVKIGRNDQPAVAAVNSFGYGGTNAHVMVASHV